MCIVLHLWFTNNIRKIFKPQQAEPYVLSYVNNYANDGRTIRKDARDFHCLMQEYIVGGKLN